MTASGALTPEARPNRGQSAAILHLGFRSGASNASVAPPLRSISFDLSRDLSLHAAGLRSCTYNALLSSVAVSEGACAAAKVGHGEVESELEVNSNYEYTPVKGHLTAYYVSASAYESPRILARVQIRHPSPIVYVLPFRIEPEKGRFATRLLLPEMRHIAGIILPGYTFPYAYDRISSLNMVLGTSFAFHGETKSFVTASCPARHGAQKAGFRIARANLSYSGSSTPQDGTLSQTVDSRCKAT